MVAAIMSLIRFLRELDTEANRRAAEVTLFATIVAIGLWL
jgi:hypothetical protein